MSDTVVEKVVVVTEKIVVEKKAIKKFAWKDDNEKNDINSPITLSLAWTVDRYQTTPFQNLAQCKDRYRV